MYSECISCPKLGVSCDGPNFVAMTAHELLEWCKLRKVKLGLSNAKLAELSGMPKGTIDRLFAGEHGEHFDFKYETIRPTVKALAGGSWKGAPCPGAEVDKAAAEEIQKLTAENAKMEDYIRRMDQMHHEELEHWREQLKLSQAAERARRKTVIYLGITLVFTLILIIAALVVDRLNPDVGFFWRDMFSGWSVAGVKSLIGL